ncbi:MAG: flagellar basal body P-ring formation chaperone FlgA [Gemmataceae bacterium]|nr:flagellar basal body P-ring formation chaperone FlgA [Gemmataceae bacterium]
MARVLLALALLPALATAEPPGGAVALRLRPRSVVRTRRGRVADLADVEGGPPALRDRIARLDAAEVAGTEALVLSARQIGFRLRLAGLPEGSFRIEGESATVALRCRTLTPEEVVEEARKELMRGLPWPADEVQVTLAQPLLAPLPALADDEQVAIQAKPRAGSRTQGRVQMDVQLLVQGKSRLGLALLFDVRPTVAVAVCRRRVEKGQELAEADFHVERQPVGTSGEPLAPASAKGAKAKRALLPGQAIRAGDVEAGGSEGPVLVREREAVRLQARVGGLAVHVLAQAMQDGRRGQLIRVQNADSKKVVMGRVVGLSLVEVE